MYNYYYYHEYGVPFKTAWKILGLTDTCPPPLFDQALPLILLYRQERTQYNLTARALPEKSPSEIYGAEHLLRVFGESAAYGTSF